VTVGGAKVVGLCQRRTRAGSLFQAACLLRWDAAALAALLALDPDGRAAAAAALQPAARGLGVAAATVEAAFLAALARR
jgi:hypothetical protein